MTLGQGAVIQGQESSGYFKEGTANAIYMNGGTLTIEEGATIQNNKGPYGAAVTLANGATGTMTGGTITGNTATQTDNEYGGSGAVRVTGGSTFNLSGGEITHNTAAAYNGSTHGGVGGICLDAGTLNISGNATVTENTASDQTANILTNNTTSIHLAGAFTGSAGVTQWGSGTAEDSTDGGTFGTAEEGASGAEHFFSDRNPNLTGTREGTILKWGGHAIVRVSNDGGTTWQRYTSLETALFNVTGSSVDQSIMELLEDVTLESCWDINNKTFTLRSNFEDDETFSILRAEEFTTKNLIYLGGSTVRLTNITLDGQNVLLNDTAVQALVYVGENANLTLGVGATLEKQDGTENTVTASAVYVAYGSLTIQEGAVIRNNTGKYGAAVTLHDRGTMTGGEIYGNYATQGDGGNSGAVALINRGTFTMSGGEITGNGSAQDGAGGVYVGSSATLNLSGSTQITGNYSYTIPPVQDENGYYVNTSGYGRDANVMVTDRDGIQLAGSLTGVIGVTQWPSSDNTTGNKFGEIADGGDWVSSSCFVNDRDPSLIGDASGDADEEGGSNLIWTVSAGNVARVRNGENGTWYYFPTLERAVAAVTNNDSVVELLRDVTLNRCFTASNKNFTLRSNSDGEAKYSIIRGSNFTDNLVKFSGGTVRLENIVIDGAEISTGDAQNWLGLICGVENANITLGQGTVVQNLLANDLVLVESGAHSAVYIKGAILTIEEGAIIRHNKGIYGAAVALMDDSTGYMSGGEIYGNYALRDSWPGGSGAVEVAEGSEFHMSGGRIYGNGARSYGAGEYVQLEYGGTGGIWVEKNSYLDDGGTVYLSGTAEVVDNYTYPIGEENRDPILSEDGVYTEKDSTGVRADCEANLTIPGDSIYLYLEDDFYGSVGVTEWPVASRDNNQLYHVFGNNDQAEGDPSDAENYQPYRGAENIFNDRNTSLVGWTNTPELNEQYYYPRLQWGRPVARMIGGMRDGLTYLSLKSAIDDEKAEEAYYIEMINDSIEVEAIAVDKTIYVNLAGYTVDLYNNQMTVQDNAAFYGFDTTTNGYNCTSEEQFGCIIGDIQSSNAMEEITNTNKVQTAEPMRYVKVTEGSGQDTKTSFHRFDMKLGNVVFRPSERGIYFKSEFYGDQWVKDKIAELTEAEDVKTYGLFLTLNENVTEPGKKNDEGKDITGWATHNPNKFATGPNGDLHQGSQIWNIVKEKADDNADRTNTPIYVSTYFNFGFDLDQVTVDKMRSITLTRVVELTADKYNGNLLNDAQKHDFEQFWEKFKDLYPNITVNIPNDSEE